MNIFIKFILKIILKQPKIIWRYHYVQACKQVTIADAINTTPDDSGRWQIRGFIKVNTAVLPEYKWAGKYVSIPIAWIMQKDCKNQSDLLCRFKCEFTSIYDANLGYGRTYFYGSTPNEVMIKIQEAFNKTYNCFLNSK